MAVGELQRDELCPPNSYQREKKASEKMQCSNQDLNALGCKLLYIAGMTFVKIWRLEKTLRIILETLMEE